MEVGQGTREIRDRDKDEVLDGAGRGLDRRCRDRCRATDREDDPVDAGRLGTAQEAAHVVRVLERVEGQDEGTLAAIEGAHDDLVQRAPPPRRDDESHTLMSVEAGQRGQRAAFDLDDGDPQGRRVQDQRIERRAPGRHDEEPARLASSRERLLDRAPAGHQLVALIEQRPRIDEAGRGVVLGGPWAERDGRRTLPLR